MQQDVESSHTYTAVSDLSNGNKAAELHYCLGRIDKEKIEKIIDSKYTSKLLLSALKI